MQRDTEYPALVGARRTEGSVTASLPKVSTSQQPVPCAATLNRRALAIAAVSAVAGGALLLLYLHRYERTVSGGREVQLLTLIRPVERGALIRDEMLATRPVPAAYVEDRAVKASERSRVLGLETAQTLSPQQTLQWTDLAITAEIRDVASLVQPGKRAMSVQAPATKDPLVRPGDYVDVLVTMDEQQGQSAVVLLQRILVLAVGHQTRSIVQEEDPDSTPRRGDQALTLSVDLEESQRLALALEQGHLAIAIRNAHDLDVERNPPKLTKSALFRADQDRLVQDKPANPTTPVEITRVKP